MTNKERYFQLCQEEDSICVYDQPWWMDAVCGADNWDVVLYEKNGTLLGAMPYYVKQKMGLRYITQPPFTQHNGAWIKYPENQVESKRISFEKEVLDGLMEQIEALPVCHYQQSFSPNLTNWLPLYWRGYSQSTNYTYRLPDIHDPEALLKAFNYDKRRNIKRGTELQMDLKFDLPASQFYEFHQQSLKKQGKAIGYTLDLFRRIYDGAYRANSGRVAYVTNSQQEILCAIFVPYDRVWAYHLITALDPEMRKTGALDFLVYKLLQYFSDKVTGYDFEGSMIPGVEESFRHFGATQTPYFRIWKTYTKNPLLQGVIRKKLSHS